MKRYQGIPWHTFRKLNSSENRKAAIAQDNYLKWRWFADTAQRMQGAASNAQLSLNWHTGELMLGVNRIWTFGLLKSELVKALDDVITGHTKSAFGKGLEDILKRGLEDKTKAAFGWIGVLKLLADLSKRLKNERLLSRNDTQSIAERDRIKVRLIALCKAKSTGSVNIYRLQEVYYQRYVEYWKAHHELLRWIFLDKERCGIKFQSEFRKR